MKTTEISTNKKKELLQQLVTLDDLDIFKHELLADIKSLLKEYAGKPSKRWLKTEEVKKLLGASTGTLTALRIKGTLPYSRIGGIIYYDSEDVEKMFDSRKIQNNKV
ncbi:helix-turn-helix domain-containing protein [Mucilaginibacter sp. Mucisp86]|uniref:helix-turn-helix domain-containing protein n=1 Tax=Mucilaginibacter sp. Mucisp86 TaxID=3243060 RepID=UPI0039B682D8